MEDEEVLLGGNVASQVVRISSTIRNPASEATPAVEAFLERLVAVGFQGAPRTLGRDEFGRHVVEYVPGRLADVLPPFTNLELSRLGALIRELPDAASSFTPPPDSAWHVAIPPDRYELVCHTTLRLGT